MEWQRARVLDAIGVVVAARGSATATRERRRRLRFFFFFLGGLGVAPSRPETSSLARSPERTAPSM